MTTVLIFTQCAYCLLLLVLLAGWLRIRRLAMPPRTSESPGISVVVAVRNEEENIENLVLNLASMVYPPEKFEVILVDDHSTDETRVMMNTLIPGRLNFSIQNLPHGETGKKAALRLGISCAKFDIIATTDADCLLSKNWLRCLAPFFVAVENKMVMGAVKLLPDGSFFSRLQVSEMISLAGSSAAMLGLGHPVMCNGANLAFRKDIFNGVGGYDDNAGIPSGDDEFLMRKIFRKHPSGIRFLNYYEATVSSKPQKSVSEFLQQRLRWAGKWRHNQDGLAKLLAVFIFISQIAFLGLVAASVVQPGQAIVILLIKLFLEGIFFFWVGRFLERGFDIPAFLCLQLLYPIYVIVIALGSLVSPYTWKGRNYK